MDSTIDKLLAMEDAKAQRELLDLEQGLRAFEAQYQIAGFWGDVKTSVYFLLSLLSDLGKVLPRPARISYHGGELVVVEYADWKARVRSYQSRRGEVP